MSEQNNKRRPRGPRVSFFPEKSRDSRKSREKIVGFRPPPDVKEYLDSLKARGYRQTEAMIDLVRIVRDIEKELGDELQSLRDMSVREGVSVGRLFGRLAKAGFAAEQETRRTKK